MKILFTILILWLSFQTSAQSNHQLIGTWIYQNDEGQNQFHIKFNQDNTYQVDFNSDGNYDLTGTFKIDGDQVTITDTEGDCEGQAGIYSMTFEASQMTLTQVTESCSNRAGEDGAQRIMNRKQ